jgi:integrase
MKRRVPKGVVGDYLRVYEVPLLLPALAPRFRPLFATAIYAGLRKGELRALRKTDVDLERRLLLVARSGDRQTTKGGHADVIPLHPELVPFLEHAVAQSPAPFVFPHVCAPGCKAEGARCPGPTGMMRADVALESVLRRAMARAGITTGYTHVCRKKGCGHRTEAPDAELQCCPAHGVALWPKPNVRPLRLHDLRHTCASLLLQSGVPMAVVQRVLRHRDPRLTSEIYGHLATDYLQAEIGRLRLFREDEGGEFVPLPRTAQGTRTAPARHIHQIAEKTPEPSRISSATPAGLSARDTGFEPVAFGSGGGARVIHFIHRRPTHR